MLQAIQPLGFAPQTSIATQLPASRESVSRFESLLYAPGAKSTATTPAGTIAFNSHPEAASTPAGTSRLRAYADEVSALWRASAQRSEQIMNAPGVSYRDLLMFQREMSSTLVSVELASKTSGMVESGVQTLIQRS